MVKKQYEAPSLSLIQLREQLMVTVVSTNVGLKNGGGGHVDARSRESDWTDEE